MRRWIALAALACASCAGPPAPAPQPVDDPLPLIDPTIGSGGFGYACGTAFIGAAVPHGLVKLGPDTSAAGTDVPFLHYSGYWSSDDTIDAFTHVHLHGAGLADYGVLAVMPTTHFDAAHTSASDYAARFDKASQAARPGHYAVTLDGADGPIGVHLAATTHGAHHVYDFGAAPAGTLVIDLDKHLYHGVIDDADLHLDQAAQTITGHLHAQGEMSAVFGGYDLYFAARTRAPWTSAEVWSGGAPASVGSDAAGTKVGAALHVATGAPVELQIALSLTSLAGAQANLAAELPAWDQAATIADAEHAWRQKTGVVRITGGTMAQQRLFYTGLYQAFLMPTVVSDVDGAYRIAGDAAVHTASGWAQLSDFSLWDTYRTVHPLYAWLAPDDASASVQSLLAFAQAAGFFPQLPFSIGDSAAMIGSSAEVVLADAALKDVPMAREVAIAAWPILRAAALDPLAPAAVRGGRNLAPDYMQYGYVSASDDRSVSFTTEYTQDDAALAEIATLAGASADAATLTARSHSWTTLFDAATGFLRAKRADGSWDLAAADFDPALVDITGGPYAEADAWQSLWMVGVYDSAQLITLLGGPAAFVDKLSRFFALGATDIAQNPTPLGDASPRSYYWHGNEPDINAAYLFSLAGRPDLTARWVRWIEATLYADTPEGKAGNDDAGTLAAWYVWSALGLYPLPGTDAYILGSPMFEDALVTVGGHALDIRADHASDTNIYVQSVDLDAVPLTTPTLTHAQLTTATTLHFVMGPTPSTWGQTP